MQAGIRGAYECIAEFSESDFSDDLVRIDVPALVTHGDDDQIVPIAAAGPKSAELIKDATLRVYPGVPHGIFGAYRTALETDLLAFLNS
ncbi:alpha/beta fold hydrolase [Nocardia sp. NPDC004711]